MTTKTRRYTPLRVISRDGVDVTDEKVPATRREMATFVIERIAKDADLDSVTRDYSIDATWGEVVKEFRSLPVLHRNSLEDAGDDLYRDGFAFCPRIASGRRYSTSYRRASRETRWALVERYGVESDAGGFGDWNPRGFSILLALATGMRVAWRPKNQRRALGKLAKSSLKTRDSHVLDLIRSASSGEGRWYRGEHTGSYGSGTLMALAKVGVVDVVGNLLEGRSDMSHNRIISDRPDGRLHEIATVHIDLDALLTFAEMRGLKEKALQTLLED